MLLDNFGTLIADFMTITPDISGVPSASAILDVSNFTVQAVTFGKNSEAYTYNAHQILSPSTLKTFKSISYSGGSVSSYYPSAVVGGVYGYKLLPDYINPIDSRLERRSTLTNITSSYDLGHNQNSVISSSLSSYYHLIGCYPASGGTNYWVGSAVNVSASLTFSGVLSSIFNRYGTMDQSGFLTVAPFNMSQGNSISASLWGNSGVVIVGTNPSSDGIVGYGIFIGPGDLGALRLFGGVYNIGLWALDIREMLNVGLTPPYSFNVLNNIRKYRLVAKRSFLNDITYSTSSFNTLFTGQWVYGGASPKALYLTWNINFL